MGLAWEANAEAGCSAAEVCLLKRRTLLGAGPLQETPGACQTAATKDVAFAAHAKLKNKQDRFPYAALKHLSFNCNQQMKPVLVLGKRMAAL